MATKKINLNELRTIINEIIKEYGGRSVSADTELDYERKGVVGLKKLIKDRIVLKLSNTKDYFKMKELLKQGWEVVSEDLNDPDHTITLVKTPKSTPKSDDPVSYSFSDRRLEN